MSKKSLVGYTLKNWGMILYKTGIDETIVVHETIYKKPSALVQTKVRITIEEIAPKKNRAGKGER